MKWQVSSEQGAGRVGSNKPNCRQAGYPSIPPFHHSNIPGPSPLRQTKPILRVGRSLRVTGTLRVGPATPGMGDLSCETKPIGLVGRSPEEGNAQNEPNFRLRQMGRGQRDAGRAAIVQNEPNLGESHVRNEPNFVRAPRGWYRWPGDPAEGRSCETNPISEGGQSMPTAACNGAYGEKQPVRCLGKQSQFPTGPGGWGPQGSSLDSRPYCLRPFQGQLCETKPIGFTGRSRCGMLAGRAWANWMAGTREYGRTSRR